VALPAFEDPSDKHGDRVASACARCGSRRPRASDSGQSGLGALCGKCYIAEKQRRRKKNAKKGQ